jgi:hypothetical protein
MQSQLTSSLLETSEDEEQKRREQEKLAAKKAKKGITERELEQLVDIELSETNTFEMLYIPGILVALETEENNMVLNQNKEYDTLR